MFFTEIKINNETIYNVNEKEAIEIFGATVDELAIAKAKFLKEQNRTNFNAQRDKELEELTINNISCTELSVLKMAVKLSIMKDNDTANWIDIDNSHVTLSKGELGALIAQVAKKTEEIHFRYRELKDKVLVA
jgi:hypothetical protein